ncbi:MAG: hypothetical protein KKD59_03565, partial [Acidobacteria bacterium]|nr:hypothetical protein [Acidobacteriota bacterium]
MNRGQIHRFIKGYAYFGVYWHIISRWRITIGTAAKDLAGNNLSEYSWEFSTESKPNNPPVFAPIGNKTLKEGELLRIIVSATDIDNDS